MGNHGGKTAPPPPKQLPPSQQTTDQKLNPNNPPVKGSKRNRSKSRGKEKSAEARQPKSAEMRGGLSTEKAKIKNGSPLKSSEKKTKESNKSKEKAPRRKITGDAKANSKEKTLSKETAVVSEYVSIVIPAPHRRKITGDSKEGKKTKGNSVYCDVPLAAPTRRKITGDPKMNELPPKKEKKSKSKEKSFEQTGDINTNNNAQKQKVLKTSPQKVQSALIDGPTPRPLTTQSLNTLSTYTEAKATVPPGKAKSVPTTGEKETRTKSIYTVTQNASKERTENSRSAEREQNGKEEGSVRKIKKSKRKKKPSVSTAEQKKREIAKQKEREKRRQLFKGAKKMIEAAKQKRSGESTYSTTIDEPKTTTMADIDDEVLAKTQDDESSLYCSTVDASKIDHFVTHTISRGCQSIEKEYNCHKEELKVDEKLCTLFYSNPTKNRTNDIPCIDSTRVILRDDRVKNIDYIHANYVNTVSKKKRFICTQTPKENTSVDFWLMILQHKTSLILMLGEYPTGQKVCYFPQEIGELSFHRADESNVIEVQCEKITEIGGDKGIRKRSLCVRRGKDEMRVDHLHCKKWEENGPADGTVQIILEEFSSYLSPIIVHCTNGTSKTGSLIALSLVVDSFDNGNTMETIENIVKSLRQQRAVTVSTVQQYLWIYRILVDIFHRFGPLPEVEEFRKQIDSRIANNK